MPTFGGTPFDPDGLLQARNPVGPATTLQDPRTPTWADQVEAVRRRLCADAEELRKSALRPTDLTARVYRYSRNVNMTNDEMGYGERATDLLWRVNGSGLEEKRVTSQRTKSGRQVILPPKA